MKKNLKIKTFIALFSISTIIGCSNNNPNTIIDNNLITASSNKSKDLIQNYFNKIKRDHDGLESIPRQEILGNRISSLAKLKEKANMTYFTYEALDNNLYQDLNGILNDLEYVGSSKDINLIAQTDNWKEDNAARYYISYDNNPDEIESSYQKLSPSYDNSGNPNVLAQSVNWAYSSYPSKRKWLNISTHGYGFAGIAYDDHPEKSMDIVSFSSALTKGLKGKKLDIISFDACLMATVEVASQLKNNASILVGSEDSTYYWGYGYYKTFAKLNKNPNMSNNQIARSLVLDVNQKGNGYQSYTTSATDLNKIDLLTNELNNLSKRLIQIFPTHKEQIIRALLKTKPFVNAQEDPFRDISIILRELKTHVKDNTLNQIGDRINHVMYRRGVILLSRQSKDENGLGKGLSIYLPLNGEVNKIYYTTKFAKTTKWDDFLKLLNRNINY